MLTRESILSKKDLKKVKVNIPEWGGDVFVSEMPASRRDQWEQIINIRDKKDILLNARAKLLVFTVVDEKGDLLFSDDDVESLGQLSAFALDKLCVQAQKLNKLTAAELEDSKKNSKAGPSGASTSD